MLIELGLNTIHCSLNGIYIFKQHMPMEFFLLRVVATAITTMISDISTVFVSNTT